MTDKTSKGFPPVAGDNARLLILGSLPGERSIAAQQYYAHPRNGFWTIMDDLLDIRGGYAARCAELIRHRIALWDVLRRSVRPGSLDSQIRTSTAEANPVLDFLLEHPDIRQIVFNGKKAEQLFHRFVDVDALDDSIALVDAPSTSPAFAAMPLAEKRDRWAKALAPVVAGTGERQ
ncbi:MAG: DNA-deoxyinosine glycosylase [Gammaproteobacteria bacterium]|nr:DNA-deoxyinosine glycosylase [Gammaproteobacteria bacterium]